MQKQVFFKKLFRTLVFVFLFMFSFVFLNNQILRADNKGYCLVDNQLKIGVETEADCLLNVGEWIDVGLEKQDHDSSILFFPYSNIEKVEKKSTKVFFNYEDFEYTGNKIDFEYAWLVSDTPLIGIEWDEVKMSNSAFQGDGLVFSFLFEVPYSDVSSDLYLHVKSQGLSETITKVSGKFVSYVPLTPQVYEKVDALATIEYSSSVSDLNTWRKGVFNENIYLHSPYEQMLVASGSQNKVYYLWKLTSEVGIPYYEDNEEDYILINFEEIYNKDNDIYTTYFNFKAYVPCPNNVITGKYKLWIYQDLEGFDESDINYFSLGQYWNDETGPILDRNNLLLKLGVKANSKDYLDVAVRGPVYVSIINGIDNMSGHATTKYEISKEGIVFETELTEDNYCLDEDGTYTITVTSIDQLGNVSNYSHNVEIDTTLKVEKPILNIIMFSLIVLIAGGSLFFLSKKITIKKRK